MKPSDSTDSTPTDFASGMVFGSFLVVAGLALVIGGARIEPSGMTNQRDIGPRVAPVALGILLMLGGVAAATERWWSGRRTVETQHSTETGSRLKSWIVLAAMIAATAFMPRGGFMAPAAALSVGLLALLGARWWEALAATIVILGMVHLLFVEMFQVRLPHGPWGF